MAGNKEGGATANHQLRRLSYTIGEQIPSEQQDQLRTRTLLDMHRKVLVPHVAAIQQQYPEKLVGSKLIVDEAKTAVIATMQRGELTDVLMRTRDMSPDEKYEYEREVFVSFETQRSEPNAWMKQERTKRGEQHFDTRIELSYGPIDTPGTIALLEPTRIRVDYHQYDSRQSGETSYFVSDNYDTCITGTSLIIENDEVPNAVTIRDDYGAEPFIVPTVVDVEATLLDVKGRLKRH